MDNTGDNYLDMRAQQLGFRPQKEIFFNKLLPYASELDTESQQMLADIKTNFGSAIMLRELQPGLEVWTLHLEKYIGLYGHKFSKEDHIAFIKIFYELVIIPNLEPNFILLFSKMLIILLKKTKLIAPTDLTLPWKPLYDLCERVLSTSQSVIGMYRYLSNLEGNLCELVHFARFYFPPEATQEILDLWRPKLCPFDSYSFTDIIDYCKWFLPVALQPDQSHLGYKLWFHEFMNIWNTCNNASAWDQEMMSLMALLAEHNIGYIDWEPYLPMMFTRFLRCLHLPVQYKNLVYAKGPKISMDLIAKWMVNVLGGNSSAQKYLTQFLKVLESYFHPANFGQWIGSLKELIKRLPAYFVARLHRERFKKPTWETPIPDSHKLTEEDITNFVEALKPTVLQAMFSKVNINDIGSALQHLAVLRPNLILPAVIDRLYSTLDSLTEPHKLTAAINAVAAVARQLVTGGEGSYPLGPTHVIPILFATLPGIDPNDIKKCFFTFQLISTFAIMVPFVDCSEASQYYELTPEEEITCSTTAQFEDFILQFMDRCFTLIESFALEVTRLEAKPSEKRSRMEATVEQGLASTFGSILPQTSAPIFAAALSKLRTFLGSCILEVKVAGKYLGSICHTFVKARPTETLNILYPYLCGVVIRLTESDETLQEETVDDELLYNLSLLQQISSVKCNTVVKYKDLLIQVLDRTLRLKCVDGYMFACTLLANVLQGAAFIGPKEYRCLDESFDRPLSEFFPVRHWGKSTNIYKLKVDWYRPGIEERNFVECLTHRYLLPELNKIDQYISGKISMDKEGMKQCLTIVYSTIAAKSLLTWWTDEAPSASKDTRVDLSSWNVKIGVDGLEVTMPNGDNIFKTVAQTILKLQDKLLQSSEDDTQSFFLIISIYDVILFSHYRNKNEVDFNFRTYRSIKKLLENRLSKGKFYLRFLLIERAGYQHRYRQVYMIPSLTETHQLLLSRLCILSTSRYSQVRIMAQSKLFQAIEFYQFSYLTVIPQLVKLLSVDPNENHDQFKGALYLLLGPKSRPLVSKHDWNMLSAIWPAIIQTNPPEKLSVIRLLDSISDIVHKNFPAITIKLEIPDSCVNAAAKLWTTSKPYPSREPPKAEKIQEGIERLAQLNEKNKQLYNSLLLSISNLICTKSLHWRFHNMALSFLRDLVHPDENYPPEVVETFLNTLIHDQLQLRKIAIKCTIFVLKQQKRSRALITVDPFEISGVKKETAKIVPGNREDNEWLTYCPQNIPRNAEEWDRPRYVHKTHIGYYCWPKELKVAAPSKDQPNLDRKIEELNPCEKVIHDFFSNPAKIEKLIEFLSLEEKKGKDKFDGLKYSLFKGIFRNHGDTHLELFKSHIEKLVIEKQESSQRCAAEIITGIICGSKYWPYEKVSSLWSWLQPTIRVALTNMTVETVVDWGVCFATSSEGRDPNKLHWMIELLLEEPLRQESSFLICGRLSALQGVLNQQSWRVGKTYTQLLELLKNHLTHEFQNVRDRLGSVLSNIFSTDLQLQEGSKSNGPNIESFLTEYIPQLNGLYSVASQFDESEAKLQNHCMEVDKPQGGSCSNTLASDNTVSYKFEELGEKERDIKLRLFKTICKGTLSTLCLAPYGIRPAYMELFPLVCLMENYDADEEMKKVCSALIAYLSQTPVLPQTVPYVLNAIEKVSSSGSWWAKLTSLDFAQIFIFHNMPLISSNPDWVIQMSKVVERLLENDRVEVREKAGEVLSGFLHCGFILDVKVLLARLKEICKTSLPKKSSASQKSNNSVDPALIAKKHAGVLGLCAFIRASPYDIPEHLPEVILLLGDHLSDPQPIPATIRKTLGDFKRTHHDDWEMHKTKFTEDELLIISDLSIPPSYFA